MGLDSGAYPAPGKHSSSYPAPEQLLGTQNDSKILKKCYPAPKNAISGAGFGNPALGGDGEWAAVCTVLYYTVTPPLNNRQLGNHFLFADILEVGCLLGNLLIGRNFERPFLLLFGFLESPQSHFCVFLAAFHVHNSAEILKKQLLGNH